jgi:hypothetical protein
MVNVTVMSATAPQRRRKRWPLQKNRVKRPVEKVDGEAHCRTDEKADKFEDGKRIDGGKHKRPQLYRERQRRKLDLHGPPLGD